MLHKQTRILFTRRVEQRLMARADEAGIKMEVVPFIQTIPIGSSALTQMVGQLPHKGFVAVFTSANAVNAVAELLHHARPEIYCLAGATHKTICKNFPASNVVGTADNAAALANTILQAKDIRQVDFFCGDMHLKQLTERLEAHGVQVNEHTVYSTKLTPVAIDGHFDAIAFLSPSAVKSYLSVNRINEETVLFTIGRTTAQSLAGLKNKIVTSSVPDAETLLDTIIEFYTTGYIPKQIQSA